jgi:AbrB family looped-hinge helix DNA binding protein
MTIVHMSEKGQIVVPKGARDKRGFGLGTAFAFLETKDGDLIFRPVKNRPKLSLIGHLKKFRGIQIPERKHRSPPRI